VTGKVFPCGFLPLDSTANFKIASLLSIPRLQSWPNAICLAAAAVSFLLSFLAAPLFVFSLRQAEDERRAILLLTGF
jgi:hypothetical protein